jgi:hypothetical protein
LFFFFFLKWLNISIWCDRQAEYTQENDTTTFAIDEILAENGMIFSLPQPTENHQKFNPQNLFSLHVEALSLYFAIKHGKTPAQLQCTRILRESSSIRRASILVIQNYRWLPTNTFLHLQNQSCSLLLSWFPCLYEDECHVYKCGKNYVILEYNAYILTWAPS